MQTDKVLQVIQTCYVDWDWDGEKVEVDVMTCEEYMDCWASSWAGGKGSDAKNILWDLTGRREGGEKIFVVYDDEGVLRFLDPYDYDVKTFQRLYDDDQSKIRIVCVTRA